MCIRDSVHRDFLCSPFYASIVMSTMQFPFTIGQAHKNVQLDDVLRGIREARNLNRVRLQQTRGDIPHVEQSLFLFLELFQTEMLSRYWAGSMAQLGSACQLSRQTLERDITRGLPLTR